jgi:hypothetical protein
MALSSSDRTLRLYDVQIVGCVTIISTPCNLTHNPTPAPTSALPLSLMAGTIAPMPPPSHCRIEPRQVLPLDILQSFHYPAHAHALAHVAKSSNSLDGADPTLSGTSSESESKSKSKSSWNLSTSSSSLLPVKRCGARF